MTVRRAALRNPVYRRRVRLACVIVGVLFIGLPNRTASRELAQQPQSDETASLLRFNEAVAAYLSIQVKLRNEVPGPVPNSSASEVSAASDLLANAIRRARPNARQGDLFDAEATRIITARLLEALRAPGSTVVLTAIDDERPLNRRPGIHMRFPEAQEMATMPPTLLRVLPPLPGELEFRIVGDFLIVRDVKAALVVDYIPHGLPRK